MPAMHTQVLDAMEQELHRKRDVWLRTLSFDMTHRECLQLVAPKEHIETLITAAEVADINKSEDYMDLNVPVEIDGCKEPVVLLAMRQHAEIGPPLRPRHPCWQPGQTGAKVIEWLNKRYVIGRRFGNVRRVLRRLNEACDNGHQLRYMFPAVLQLCKGTSYGDVRIDKWIDKHAAYKACRFTPAVTPEFKRAIQDASALLTSMALVGDDVPITPEGFVSISVSYRLPSFTADDGTTWPRL